MNRETYENTLKNLPVADDNFAEIPQQVDILAETPKALLIEIPNGVTGWHDKQVWFPKSQLAHKPHGAVGCSLCVKRGWITRNRLWWITH